MSASAAMEAAATSYTDAAGLARPMVVSQDVVEYPVSESGRDALGLAAAVEAALMVAGPALLAIGVLDASRRAGGRPGVQSAGDTPAA